MLADKLNQYDTALRDGPIPGGLGKALVLSITYA